MPLQASQAGTQFRAVVPPPSRTGRKCSITVNGRCRQYAHRPAKSPMFDSKRRLQSRAHGLAQVGTQPIEFARTIVCSTCWTKAIGRVVILHSIPLPAPQAGTRIPGAHYRGARRATFEVLRREWHLVAKVNGVTPPQRAAAFLTRHEFIIVRLAGCSVGRVASGDARRPVDEAEPLHDCAALIRRSASPHNGVDKPLEVLLSERSTGRSIEEIRE